jgi:hypothetical protein
MHKIFLPSKTVIYCLALSAIFTTLGCKKEATPPVVVVDTPVGIASTANVDGKSFTNLAIEYWSISLSLPKSKNPLFTANTNPDLSKFISGNIVFLHGADAASANRTITIKKGQYIFAVLQSGASWYTKGDTCDPKFIPKAGQSDLDFLRDETGTGFSNPISLSATLDGKVLYTNLYEQRVKTGIFEALVHPDYDAKNCDWRPKKSIVYSDGYWVAFQPSAGVHDLVIGGKIPLSSTTAAGHLVNYTLKVE